MFILFLQFRIFVMMGNTNDVCYFVLEMFVIMGNISNVLMLFTLLYFIIR